MHDTRNIIWIWSFWIGQIHFSFGILGGNLGEQGNGRFVAYWIGNTEMIPFCNV